MKFHLSGLIFFATSLALISHEDSGEEPEAEATDIVLTAPAAWEKYTVERDLVPAAEFGRKLMEPMNPRYITIHATQNSASTADALSYAKGQREGKFKSRLGYIAWHFTVDQQHAIQSLPCNERGQHADFEGPGNTYSIGIEMCENSEDDRAKTLDRTARLCALLMAEYQIPLQHIVPHHHWRRIRDDGTDLGHKDCPHFLLEDGKPGKKWKKFLGQVLKHYKTHPKFNAALVHLQASQPTAPPTSKSDPNSP